MVQGYPAEAGEGSGLDALSEKLTTTLIYSLTVLEAGSWKSRCLQGWLLLESPREHLFLPVLHLLLPAISALLGFRAKSLQ